MVCEGYVSFLRAIETLYQLINDEGYIEGVPLYIEDEPSYKWRG